MITDFEIRFIGLSPEVVSRAAGITEMLGALTEYASSRSAGMDRDAAADAHNYICYLETKLINMHYKFQEMYRIADISLKYNELQLKSLPTPPAEPTLNNPPA